MKPQHILIAAIAGGALVAGSSCSLYREYQTPDSTPITKAYTEAREQGPDSTALGALMWEDVFTDPTLAGLINQALANNTSLRNAQSNIEIAQAQLKGAKQSFLPSVAFAPNGGAASYGGSSPSWSYTLPVQVNWEADIFGKLLNSKRSAQASVYQSEAYAQAVRSQIIAGVANCYYGIAIVQRQIELYRTTSKLWSESVQTMKDLKESGRTTEAAVVQSTANYYNVLAGLTDLEVTLRQLNNTMSLLLNVEPRVWSIPSDATLQLPVALKQGVPMSVLAFRPDVAAAEQTMATAYYATNTARAAFYPSLGISVTGGYTNLLGSFIQNPGDWFYQLGASLTAPIFSRGKNKANLRAAEERQKQALNNFEYTVLSAAAEVNNGLVIYDKAVTKGMLLNEQVANLEKSVEYTNDLLRYSTGTYLEVLNAQQSLLSAQMSALSTELTRIKSIINLYQAMGGGR